MRDPAQIQRDDLKPGERKRTGAPLDSAYAGSYLNAATSDAPPDDFVEWGAVTVVVTLTFRFGESGARGLGSGALV